MSATDATSPTLALAGLRAPVADSSRRRPSTARLVPPPAVLGIVLCVAAVAEAAVDAPADGAFGRGLLELLIVGVPIAAGLYARRTPATARIGAALLALGAVWSLTALAESPLGAWSTVGRLATGLMLPGIVYVILAVPRGRIAPGLDRVLLGAVIVLSLIASTEMAPLVRDSAPGLIRAPGWMVELVWVGLSVSMVRRWRAASALQRHTIGPVFAAAATMGLYCSAFVAAGRLGAPARTLELLSEGAPLPVVTTCAAVLVAVLWRQMAVAGALARLALALPSGDATVAARGALADGGAQLLFRDGDGWHDADGRPAEEPRSPGRGRAVTSAVSDDGSRSVAVVHDARLGDDPELLEGVAGMVLADRRREGVRSELAAALEELRQSRRRIAEAADCERARIERDLHDGAQQQLIALRIRLQLAEEKLQQDPTACGADLQELGFAVERAQLELQSLARGVCPPVLMDRGPADALRCLAAEAPMPVHVRSGPLPRQPVAIESAVYFTCAEAVQNALKHAAGASGVTISLGLLRGALCFEVCDDGGGFSAVRRDGRGLANMRDRIEAVGGRLTIASRPGAGTRVAGAVTTT